MTVKTLTIPDMGADSSVEVVEVSVKAGDVVEQNQVLIVVESDKASVEIPSDFAGTVTNIQVAEGDFVKQGDVFISLDVSGADDATATEPDPAAETVAQPEATPAPVTSETKAPQMTVKTLTILDMGSDASVEVVEVSVKAGDVVEQNQLLIVVESDKASVEIPSDFAGTVNSVDVAQGDLVKQGDAFLTLTTEESVTDTPTQAPTPSATSAEPTHAPTAPTPSSPKQSAPSAQTSGVVYAGPAVRKQARELGVDLSQVPATGARNRITKEDVDAYVRQRLNSAPQAAALPSVPQVDFAEYGEISTQKLNGVKRATAKAMTAAWLNIPHVTHFDEADITELEAFRKEKNTLYTEQGIKFSVVPFVLNALARALKEFPTFNASLNADGESLTLKHYVHIGVAVDTPKGLLVPAVRNVDALSIVEITRQLNEKAGLARDGKLPLTDMKGASFTLSSLGGIGGTAFTPIVNAPEVAILGLSRAVMKPRWNGEAFEPRLMLPLSLSYDHRVIDGAEAARFSKYVVELLQDNTRWPM